MNFKNILSLILGLFLSVLGYSQNTLSGKVIDITTNTPIANAKITISDLHNSTQSDASGNFKFMDIPSSEYLVTATVPDYKATSQTVNVKGETVIDFNLDKSSTEIAEVVITGSSKATQIKKSPLPIVSISQAYLKTNLSTNVIDAISKIPGVTAVTTGPNISKPYIRGLGFNRILTLYNGVRQEGQQWGDEHGIEVDNYGVDRIEVIKGPASLMYGSDALAGVVNLIPTETGPEGKISGSATTEYQSNNGMLGGSLFLTGNNNGFEYGGRISQQFAKDYKNKIDGRVYNTGFRQTGADAFFGIHKKWGFSHLNVSLFDDTQEIPDGSRDSLSRKFTNQITEDDLFRPIVSDQDLNSYKIAVIHQRVQHYRAFLRNSFYLGDSRLDANFAFQSSQRREFSHPENPYQDVPGLDLKLKTFNYDLKYYLPEFDKWAIVVGVNGMSQNNNVLGGTEFVIPSYNQFDLGAFATVKKDWNKFTLAGGIRYDLRHFKNDALYTKPNSESGFDEPVYGNDRVGADQPFNDYSTNYDGVTGSLGATYAFNKQWAIKANLARGYRAPNVSEISADGVHPGTGFFQIGSSTFKPEFSNQADFGGTYSSQFVNAGLSLFANHINNYIYNTRLQDADGNDVLSESGGQQYPTYQFKQGKVLLYGLEGNIDFHIVKNLHFENSASLIYGNNESFTGAERNNDNKYVPQMPPFRLLSELRYDLGENSKMFSKAFVKAQLQYTATQNRVYSYDDTETATQGYTLFNLGLGTSLLNKNGNNIVDVYVLANNIFDVAYQDHLSRLKYFEDYSASPNGRLGIFNMGRNISLKLIKTF
ncbi:TonB-dependent receptor [Halpernia frigidisoli]|uniref:Iron complex outermembrane recepter protein n=1 Tax=Halpernia frigidisoli TaxID=1125876 RepID=A0A1I3FQC0_9FLAO|nr:TonB-dependent receptor [Halpernia frigidisoli]SFI13327.1 iron complex outermembrane recepter protein [Halpernia frigidisoli]